MEKYRFFVTLVVMIWSLAACGPKKAATAALVETRAAVETVEVRAADGEAPQVLVRGQLPDGCTRVGEPVVSRGGRIIAVILPAYRDSAAQNCAGAQPFEQVISLGGSLEPGRYSVSVNGVQAVLDLPGQQQAAATATILPTSAPTEVPTEPAIPMPAATSTQDPTPVLAVEKPAVEIIGDPTSPEESEACVVKGAFFLDVSVPDGTVFNPGEPFTKTWRIKNAGTCGWQGYSLVFQQGDRLGSQGSAAVPGIVTPGSTVDISIDFTAPQMPGSYFSDWLLSTAGGEEFGLGNPPVGLLWLRIGVRSKPAEAGGGEDEPAAEKPDLPAGDACRYQTDPAYESQVLALINSARQERGLAPLQPVDPLSDAARGHSTDMACHDFVEHYGYDGSTWLTRIKARGVPFRSASENIYAGNPDFGGTPEGAFTWWMNSQIHRDNILNSKAKQIGVGYVFFAGSTYKGYYTLNFVEP